MLNESKKAKLIVILGPTSSGKTGLAEALAQEFNGLIIAADSRQIYRYLDIGTGKAETAADLESLRSQRQRLLSAGPIKPEEYVIQLHGVDNYMIDLVEPDCDYNVALYQRDVFCILNSKFQIPNVFLVGGTGLYINAVVDNMIFPAGEPNLELRAELESQIELEGLEPAWERLIKLDPGCASCVQKQNPRRVVRALEYVISTGQKFSENRGQGERQFDVLKIGVQRPRADLYQRIDQRVDERIKLGMIEEVEFLHQSRGLSWARLSRFGLEYRVIGEYLKVGSQESGARSQEAGVRDTIKEMSQRLKWDIHAYARRQLTWFRRDKEIQWVAGIDEARQLVEVFINSSKY